MQFKLLLGVSCLVVPAVAAAQDQPESDMADAIVVTGQRAQQERSIALKRDAIGILDVAAADEIGQLPDRNVAEVIERLPGVGVQYDQGEGRYVAIRGIPSELNNYTVNGFELGNPDGNTRKLPLDIVSGQLLNRVEVSKAKTADQDGQGIGGTVNLVTQTAFDFADPFVLSASAQIGHQEIDDRNPIRGDISVGGRFGADEQFGILVGASYSDRTFTSYGLYPDDWAPFAGAARDALPTNLKATDYRLNRERIGAIASLDWRPTDNAQYWVRGLYSRFSEDEYRQRYRLDFATADMREAGTVTLNPDGVTGVSTETGQRSDLRLEQKDKSVLTVMAGGRNDVEDWTVDYGAAYGHNEVDEPNQVWQFRGNPGVVDFDFTDTLYTAVPREALQPADLGFRQYTEQDESGEEDIWSGRLDVTRRVGVGADSFLRAGVKYRRTDKRFDANNMVYGRGSADNRFSLDGLSGEPAAARIGDGKVYRITPTIDAGLIQAYTEGKLGGPQFVLNEADTLADGTLADLDLEEEVAAAYVMANLDLGDVTITPGLRVERTKLATAGFQLANEADVVPVADRSTYTDWLPSLLVRITPSRDTVVRLAYTRSVGRPQYSDLTPGGEIGYEDNGDGTFDGSVSLGNPSLQPYVSDAIDVSGEYYFAKGGLFSVGAFAKFIKNPIYTADVTLTDTSYGGRDYSVLEISQRQNGESADIIGLEASLQQQFTFLPGFLSGFGVNANVTWTDSTLRVPGRTGAAPFPEQSELLYGAQLFFQKGPVEASVAYHHTGRALIALGDEPLTDQHNDDLRRLDAKASFAVTPNLALFAEGQNLTDEPTRQYQGNNRSWVIQNERYGRTVWMGASFQW